LTFLDTGMVGELDLRKRISFAHFLLAFRDKDVSGMATALRALSTPFREPNESAYQREFELRLGPLVDPSPGQSAPLQKLVSEALDVLRDSSLRLDSQLTLAVKALAQAEAITWALVPESVDRHAARLRSISRLIAAAIVITGVLIGSALAAAIETGESAFRTDVADMALVAYLVATAIAAVFAAALLWRLIRPEDHRRHRRRDLG
jgi:hypothetical protein